MAEYVQSGEKILASQYNALVDAIAGPTNATTDQPFTQTKNGIVINGGLGDQQTKAAALVPALFEVSYGTGHVGYGYSSYQEGQTQANRFNGVFLNIGQGGTVLQNSVVLGNGVVIPSTPNIVVIDPTSQSLAVVPYNNRLEQTISNGKMPLCLNTEDAGYAVVQILDSGNGEKINNGDLLIVAGNFVKAGARGIGLWYIVAVICVGWPEKWQCCKTFLCTRNTTS